MGTWVEIAKFNCNNYWKYRKKLTIDHGDIDGALTNFPVLVKLTNANFTFTQALATGADIRFDSGDGLMDYKYEIERWDASGEKAEIWVKIPSVASGADTDFYMYWGNAVATDAQDVNNVWDSNFKFVSHMKDDPDTSHILDSTSQSNDGTKKGAGEPAEDTSSQIAYGQHFDGNDDLVAIDTALLVDLATDTVGTVEFWVYVDADGGAGMTCLSISRDADATTTEFFIGPYFAAAVGEDNMAFVLRADGALKWQGRTADNTMDPYVGSWLRCALVHDGVAPVIYFGSTSMAITWADQTDKTKWMKAIITDAASPSDVATLGRWKRNGGFVNYKLDGLLDEVRISSINRAAEWIKASYESERDDLITFDSAEGGFY